MIGVGHGFGWSAPEGGISMEQWSSRPQSSRGFPLFPFPPFLVRGYPTSVQDIGNFLLLGAFFRS